MREFVMSELLDCGTCKYGNTDANCEFPPCCDCGISKTDGSFNKWESADEFDVFDEKRYE